MTPTQKAVEAAVEAYAANDPHTVLLDGNSMQAALSAALAVDGVALQGWQDISTAPKDGTRILWSCGDDKMSVIHWPEYDLCFEGGYWMPLPKPPAASDREERR